MKKMSFLLAIVLLLSFYLGGCSQPQPNPKLDDLNLLCETLETEHYDLYANVSEEEFQDEREKIARQTPNMTDAEFYWSVRHLLSLVGDIDIAEPSRRDECCGFGGMFSVEENAVSVCMGRDKVRDHMATGAEYITGADSSCLMHMQGVIDHDKLPIRTIHAVEILNSKL